jgi:hypothetical protein
MDDSALIPVADESRVCANCGILRIGKWCHGCGQHEDMVHRSVRKLGLEAFEHLTSVDGKVFRTVAGLIRRPASLTRSFLDGHRVAQLPPLSLFLVFLVVFLFIAGQTVDVKFELPTPAQIATMPAAMRWWVLPVGTTIHAHPQNFLSDLAESAELFGLFTVPVAALLLWGLFAGGGWKLYDHLIFALHSLSFQFLVVGFIFALGDWSDPWRGLLVFAMAGHLFVHMRGVYGGGILATLARMALLGIGTFIAYTVLLAAWVAVAYTALWVEG